MGLLEKELARYQRQMLIDDWGEEGQKKLRDATVFIAGAGGLGSPAALFLAAAGIGRLKICDPSEVFMTNLNRQILFREWDIGTNKAYAARQALMELNPHVEVEPIDEKITQQNIAGLVADSTIILDCLDNFASRYILNRLAVNTRIPFIHAGIEGMAGQITVIHAPETPCLACIFPEPLPSKKIFPIAGAASGMLGTLQACEAIKWVLGMGENLKDRLLAWDGKLMQFHEIEIKKDPGCPVCGNST